MKTNHSANPHAAPQENRYLPMRYVLAILITLLEVAAIIGIVVALCYLPYFYLLAWATEIACVIRIIA